MDLAIVTPKAVDCGRVKDKKSCLVDGCEKKSYVRGWCTTHYQRWLNHGDPLAIKYEFVTKCTASGCDRKVFAKKLCSKHYKDQRNVPYCSVDGCGRKAHAKDLCLMHRKRERKHGSVDFVLRPANGVCERWIKDMSTHTGDECLIWPFAKDRNGYGPSRKMCIAAHGEPAESILQAAHSCGNGNLGCMNPKHLRWATRKDNAGDMVDHGRSQRGGKCNMAKLTESAVKQIRVTRSSESCASLARELGVTRKTVSRARYRETWAWLE